jgi:hypothetical protein
VAHLLEELVVLERRGTARADRALVLVVGDRVALAGGQSPAVVAVGWRLAARLAHLLPFLVCRPLTLPLRARRRIDRPAGGIGAGNPGGATFHAELFTDDDGGCAFALVDEPFEQVPQGGLDLARGEEAVRDRAGGAWTRGAESPEP